VPALLWLQFST